MLFKVPPWRIAGITFDLPEAYLFASIIRQSISPSISANPALAYMLGVSIQESLPDLDDMLGVSIQESLPDLDGCAEYQRRYIIRGLALTKLIFIKSRYPKGISL